MERSYLKPLKHKTKQSSERVCVGSLKTVFFPVRTFTLVDSETQEGDGGSGLAWLPQHQHPMGTQNRARTWVALCQLDYQELGLRRNVKDSVATCSSCSSSFSYSSLPSGPDCLAPGTLTPTT